MRITGLRSAENYAGQRKKHSLWKRIVAALACIVVFVTTYMLILPAITAENQTYCGKEHEHTLQCFSDPNADVESQETWEKDIQNISLTGKPAEDIVAVAKSQIGYEESQKNYNVTEDGQQKGYTRYGAWYGDCYGDWDAMFVAFCLNYAGVQDYPADADCKIWMEQVSTEPYNDFHDTDAYQPQAGNLIFFDTDKDGEADHIGVVVSTDAENAKVQTIEGDVSDRVQYSTYASDDATILGYASIPDDAEEDSSAAAAQGNGNGNSGGQSGSGETDATEGLKATEAPDYIGTIPTTNTAWQITEEKYTGREQSNKQAVDADGNGKPDIYLQKNVVPTDTENEFLVYLSMDKKMTMEKFFDQSRCGVTSSNGYDPGEVVDSLKGKHSEIGAKGEKGKHKYIVKLQVYERQGDKEPVYNYYSERWGSTPNCSNGSAYIALAGTSKYLILRNQLTLKNDGNGQGDILEATIYLDSVQIDFSSQNVVFQTVTDVMGEYVEYLGVKNSDGTATFDEKSDTLTWNPVDNASVVSTSEVTSSKKSSTITGWQRNICQLVYRVRLRVDKEGFQSCADTINSTSASIQKGESYVVNKNATLQYHMESISETTESKSDILSATYPVPEVRGLLYDISFNKKSDSGKSLAGATFTLSGADDNLRTIKTVKDETSQFTNLPCGTYDLQETSPPKGYTAPADNTWTIDLNYTNNRNVLAQNSLNPTNMRYTGNDKNGQWVIVNTKNPYTYQINILKTDDTGETVLQNASFSIVDPEDMAKTLTGTTDENGSLSFDAAFKPNIEYVLTETSAPDGYNLLPAAIRFKVTEPDDEDSGTEERTVELTNSDELNNLVQLTLSEQEDGKGLLTIQVKNQEGYELPETGGHGTISFTLCGLACITGALMYKYYQIYHKKKRRAE